MIEKSMFIILFVKFMIIENVKMKLKTRICYPQKNPNTRYLLAETGCDNLLWIGLNPSTANEEKLDPTSRNIAKISTQLGYDGWILSNLYPIRTSRPDELPVKKDEQLFWENIQFLDGLFSAGHLKISNVVLAWGDNIDRFTLPYLKEAAYWLHDRLQKYDLDFHCIGTTKKENPYHPSPQVVNTKLDGIARLKLMPFDYAAYAYKIKKDLGLGKY